VDCEAQQFSWMAKFENKVCILSTKICFTNKGLRENCYPLCSTGWNFSVDMESLKID